MATNTSMTFLMVGATEDNYSKLVDIVDFPDLGRDPQMLDATTLSHTAEVQIEGIEAAKNLEFTYLYTPEDFAKIEALRGKDQKLAVYLGGTPEAPTGSEGKFKFTGSVSTTLSSGGVNEVRKAKIKINVTSAVSFSSGS